MDAVMNHITELLLLALLIITFLQSGLDKILDWKGNVGWLTEHFSKTFLRGMVSAALAVILVVEIVAALLMIVGVFYLISDGSKTYALYGAVVSCVALLMLLFGQRIAKDYEGAKGIVIYFIPAIFTVFLLCK